jgi:hypothetical protein
MPVTKIFVFVFMFETPFSGFVESASRGQAPHGRFGRAVRARERVVRRLERVLVSQ